MKKLGLFVGMISILSLIYAGLAWAQQTPPGPGRGEGMRGSRRALVYNPQTVGTISGEVTSVNQMPGMAAGVHLLLKTDKETVTVVLGPSAYLDQQGMKIAAGDKVEVTGSRVASRQGALIVAGELRKGDQVLKLRDAQGVPLWPPQGPRR